MGSSFDAVAASAPASAATPASGTRPVCDEDEVMRAMADEAKAAAAL